MDLRPDLTIRGFDVLVRPHTWISVELFDGINLPLCNKSFDWVTIVDVLHHTETPEILIAEASRVARLGIIIKDHLCEGFAAALTLRTMDWFGNKGHQVRCPHNYLPRAKWTRFFREAGLTPSTCKEQLGLYPAPFSFLFDRQLHFIAALR
jgi:SAM-dependent methyltransferase